MLTAVARALHREEAPPWVLDDDLALALSGGEGLALEPRLRDIVAELGEPMVSLFLPGEIEQLLRQQGFTEIVHFGPDEALRTYFAGRSDVRFGGVQRLVIATVTGDRP